MRKLFYTRLAFSNIRRNRKFYLPYIFTCIFTIAMFYIIDALNAGHMLDNMRGEMVLRSYMAIGGVVIAIFAIIFLFYTNSFLTRRRRHEFGLYNILGMEKRHIARVMLMESLFIAVVSLALGIAAGAGLAKVVALTALKLVQAEATFGFEFVPGAARLTLIVFAGIFAFSYLVELLRMRRSSAIDLLRSAEHGEREPKTRWLMTLLGLACMGGGYYIAVTTEDPVEAVMLFMVAVVLVILGTYMLFIAGSVALLKLLRTRKSYYYKPNHFISISGMIYRMKQNAAGLASICILSTMVLVMVSSTVSLAIGTEDTVRRMYPYEMVFQPREVEDTDERGRAAIEGALEQYGVEPENYVSFRSLEFYCERIGNTYNLNVHEGYQTMVNLSVLPWEDYLRMNPDCALSAPGEGEALMSGTAFDSINLGGLPYRVTGQLKNGATLNSGAMFGAEDQTIVVRDMQELQKIADMEMTAYGHSASALHRSFAFDIPLEGKALEKACDDVIYALGDVYSDPEGSYGFTLFGPRWEGRENQYALSGGLMFLGVFLGILFVIAMVLMMYYKQISEGYDDRDRFAIMRKVGLDDREIRRSIHSQVLTVFFLPLITACIHTSVAFLIVRRVLMIFGLTNAALLMACTGGTMLVFAGFYVITYLVTANVYYRIVSGSAA